jgi:uncharacterized protein
LYFVSAHDVGHPFYYLKSGRAFTYGDSFEKIKLTFMEKHHDLLHEFPQYREKIHELKISSAYFRKMFDDYHEVDHAIHRIESGTEPTTDEHLNQLRLQRVHLKDTLYRQLLQ